MRNYILMVLIIILLVSGCKITEESITSINQQIEDRYNSFSTLQYTITDPTTQKQYTEIFKKPDKRKQIFDEGLHITICNQNIAYSLTRSIVNVYEYINLPQGMTTYCGYFVNKGADKWKIPMEITDQSKYKVETSMVEYDGKNAVKAVVTTLISEEAKQKQIAIGNIPREIVVTYWFDMDTFAILKEESHGYGIQCEATEASGSGTGCREIETRVERIYEDFQFDINIPDSEFEIDTSDYPDVEFKKEIVDAQEKFD
jgi:outer membrane lipoprotein-sorting protein